MVQSSSDVEYYELQINPLSLLFYIKKADDSEII